jgi:UDP-3-O-[3-hydroxymyristoyl] glucosamine N-acyltransferase
VSLLLGHIVDALKLAGGRCDAPPSTASRHWSLRGRVTQPEQPALPTGRLTGGLCRGARHARCRLARGACIVATTPMLYFARVTQWWKRGTCLRVARHASQCGGGSHGAGAPYGDCGALCVVERGASVGAARC